MKWRCLLLVVSMLMGDLHAETRIRLLDVGEGQAVLLSSQGRGVLIDTGHAGQAQALLARLSAYGVRELAFVVLTHLHPDHASGLFRIREAFPEVTVLTSCHPLPANVAPDMTRWLYEYLRDDTRHNCISAGKVLQFADTRLEVLWPTGFDNNDLNAHSLVLHIKNARDNILIMGDAGVDAERQLLDNERLPQQVDVLVVGHHGAADASSEAFLRYIRPRRAVISVNADNIRGYPGKPVIERLEALGIRLQRTDQHGDIEL